MNIASILNRLGGKRNQLTFNGKAIGSVKTVRYTIAAPGVAVDANGDTPDFNLAADDNTTEQVIDLGHAVPALARVLDIKSHTEVAFNAEAVSLTMETGNSSSGHEFIGAGSVLAKDAITCVATDHDMTVAPAAAASHVFCAFNPGAKWNLINAGCVAVYITYIEAV